jgi:hypothetical protein
MNGCDAPYFGTLMTKMKMKQYIIVSLALALSACGNAPEASMPKGAVTFAELQSAVQTVFAIDYLPFTQIEDGCYARSLYMAMELSAKGIPVSSQFLIATTGSLSPQPNLKWNYHVAPVVWVKDFLEPSIIDPSMSDQVTGRAAWVTKLKPTGTYELKFASGSETVVNSPLLKAGPHSRSEMIGAAAEVGKFRVSDITNSCRTMETAIKQEAHLQNDEREEKVVRLTKRTKFLVGKLTSLGLGPDANLISDDPNTCY